MAAAATATLKTPWRGRLRALLLAYAAVSFVYIGVLWDLEHLLAIALGLALGPYLVGRRIDLRARSLSRHEYRLLASGAFLVSAAAAFASSLSAAGGPLTVGLDDTETSLTSGSVFVVIWLLVANGLRSGRRRAWRFAVGLTIVSLLAIVAIGIALAGGGDHLGLAGVGLHRVLDRGAQLAHSWWWGRRCVPQPVPAAGAADGRLSFHFTPGEGSSRVAGGGLCCAPTAPSTTCPG